MGLAHIASAVGTKTLVIFGPTNPKTTRPWNSRIIRRDVECSPCMLRDCPIDHRCMTRISPDEVFDKAVEMIYDTMPNEKILIKSVTINGKRKLRIFDVPKTVLAKQKARRFYRPRRNFNRRSEFSFAARRFAAFFSYTTEAIRLLKETVF
jgi:hypothetical protein